MPLAMVDTQTVDRADCIAVDVIKHGSYTGEEISVQHNPEQRFYYISNQKSHEMWLFLMAMWDPNNPDGYFQGTHQYSTLLQAD